MVVWLKPLSGIGATLPAVHQQALRLVQRDKTFEPHLLVIEAGSMVEFPNDDPFFHNVFSLFEGKRFDLGLYEAGSTRSLLFDKRGILLSLLQHTSRDERGDCRRRNSVFCSF